MTVFIQLSSQYLTITQNNQNQHTVSPRLEATPLFVNKCVIYNIF